MNLNFEKYKSPALKGIQLTYFILFVFLIGYAFYQAKYFIVEEDEEIYYNSARIFNETGSVHAAECNTENVAKVWGSNWYGPMYNVVYGGLSKLIGFHVYNFLLLHIACLIAIIILIYRADFNPTAKLLITCSLFTLFGTVIYTFSFYPETLHLLFGTILALQLKRIYDTDKTNGNTRKQIILFLITAFVFAIFRVTFIFWCFGLLAFSKSKKDFTIKLVTAIALLFTIFMYIKYFNAQFYGGSMSHVVNMKITFNTFIYLAKKVCENIYIYFTRNPFYDLLNFIVIGALAYSYYLKRDKLILAACLVTFMYFSILLVLYIPHSIFFNKQTANINPLLFIALYYAGAKRIKEAVFIMLVFFSPLAYLKGVGQIHRRKVSYTQNENLKDLGMQLSEVRNKIGTGKPITILTLYREFDDKIPLPDFMTSLPVSTPDGQIVTITSNFGEKTYNGDTAEYSKRFKMYGKLYIDYIISRHPLAIDSTVLTYQTDLFYLYKNNKRTK